MDQASTDETYGYSEKNPIKVGGSQNGQGSLHVHRFLNGLRSPAGADILYARTGSCCPFPTSNTPGQQTGFLERYILTWEGSKKSLTLYFNTYGEGPLYLPKGLTRFAPK